MKRALLAAAVLLMIGAAGCSKTWVDDDGNFERAFMFKKGPEEQVIHSYYREDKRLLGGVYKTYFFAIRLPESKTDEGKYHQSETKEEPDARSRFGCDANPPSWFVSKAPEHYEMWVLKDMASFREFRDKDDGTTYLCAGRGIL
jgi:hypothetical protein